MNKSLFQGTIIKENMSSNKYSIKSIILISLCLQNAGYALIRKYSTQTEKVSSKEILLVAELLKIILAIRFILTDKDKTDSQGSGLEKLIWLTMNSTKMFVLAAIYGAMNILSFVALNYIGAGEFTICAQLKILTTAGFSVLVLGTVLTWTKWRALGLLFLGCILVVSPNFSSHKPDTDSYLQIFGYGAVLSEVVLSGFATIYFEKVVKSTTEVITIWERNFQLGIYSILMYGTIILYESNQNDGRMTWGNWSFLTFLVALLGATGGLLVVSRFTILYILFEGMCMHLKMCFNY